MSTETVYADLVLAVAALIAGVLYLRARRRHGKRKKGGPPVRPATPIPPSAAANSPPDIVELWTLHARRQFEMLSEQTKELTALGQKIAGESAAPIARSFNQVFKKAS